jgi:hypothetical protein
MRLPCNPVVLPWNYNALVRHRLSNSSNGLGNRIQYGLLVRNWMISGIEDE